MQRSNEIYGTPEKMTNYEVQGNSPPSYMPTSQFGGLPQEEYDTLMTGEGTQAAPQGHSMYYNQGDFEM